MSSKRRRANPRTRQAPVVPEPVPAAPAPITLDTLTADSLRALRIAEEAGNANGMIQAIVALARLKGFADPKPADPAEQAAQQAAELKTAGALLSAAATSLGLEPNAPPSAIVGAASRVDIWPPEIYRIFHASARNAGEAPAIEDGAA